MIRRICMIIMALAALGSNLAGAETAKDIIDVSGVKGGLVVVIGSDDTNLLAEFGSLDGYIVQALDSGRFDVKPLPYIDNLVNLIVAGAGCKVSGEEIKRTLAPRGVLIANLRSEISNLKFDRVGKYKIYKKPVPNSIDNWSHYLHGPGNNAVANDTVVGPPRKIQWVGAPEWTRNHHKLNSISSVVTANGRLFFILDTATAANLSVPGKWVVIARDAFSGVDLWEKPMKSWTFHGARFRSGPAQVTRLLVASDDSLYVPLGLNEPISRLDAATGKTLKTYKNTAAAEEIILINGNLIALIGSPIADQAVTHQAFRGKQKGPNRKTVTATDIESGKELWKWSKPDVNPMTETMAADVNGVYFQVNNSVTCLDLKTGKEKWTYGDQGKTKATLKGSGKYLLVVSDGVVLCQLSGKVVALSADKGTKLWDAQGGQGFRAPLDLFVINNLVYTGSHSQGSISPPPVNDFSHPRNLHTGEVMGGNRVMVDLQTVGHHHRCYRNKATSRFILQGKRGIEMQDLQGDEHSRNNWLRGTCQYGVMPANGLIYAPSHSCGCYMESKLWGFWALGAAAPVQGSRFKVQGEERLVKGPAFAKASPFAKATGDKTAGKHATQVSALSPQPSGTWPMLRGNALRSGVASTVVGSHLKEAWSMTLKGRLTQPIVAGGKVVVSAIDENTVYALSEKDGNVVWQRTVGGRVDSSPAIYKGMVIFGCVDGRVYALRLSDGELVWSFLAAQRDRRTVAFNQVESVWPVRGSVLVMNDIVYCSAGRSTWLDKGIDLYGLDPVTGKVLHNYHYESEHPALNQGKDKAKPEYIKVNAQNKSDYKTALQPDLSDSFSMAGGCIQDILVSDGKNVFMHQAKFNSKLEKQDKMTRHFFSTSGLLDGNENHRSHWVIGTGDFSMVGVAYSWIVNGAARYGTAYGTFTLMMAYDDNSIWGIKRKNGYNLFKLKNTPFSDDEKSKPDFSQGKDAKAKSGKKKKKDKAAQPKKESNIEWQKALTMRPRAMVKAGHLFIGGMAAQPGKDDPHALYEGRSGGLLQAVSAKDGGKVTELKLTAPVVWDGMAAANGKLFIVTMDGKVTCFAGE